MDFTVALKFITNVELHIFMSKIRWIIFTSPESNINHVSGDHILESTEEIGIQPFFQTKVLNEHFNYKWKKQKVNNHTENARILHLNVIAHTHKPNKYAIVVPLCWTFSGLTTWILSHQKQFPRNISLQQKQNWNKTAWEPIIPHYYCFLDINSAVLKSVKISYI